MFLIYLICMHGLQSTHIFIVYNGVICNKLFNFIMVILFYIIQPILCTVHWTRMFIIRVILYIGYWTFIIITQMILLETIWVVLNQLSFSRSTTRSLRTTTLLYNWYRHIKLHMQRMSRFCRICVDVIWYTRFSD